MKIEELPPGNEMDRLVLEHVLGKSVPRTPPWSTDIRFAWVVVDWARSKFSRWLMFSDELQRQVSFAHDVLIAHTFVWRVVKPVHIYRAALKISGIHEV